MIAFRGGPADGVLLCLEHSPRLLRVVRDTASGEWDALDQPDDEPRDGEEISVYWLRDVPAYMHLKTASGSKMQSGYYVSCTYHAYTGKPPDDATLRDSRRWQTWAAIAWAGLNRDLGCTNE